MCFNSNAGDVAKTCLLLMTKGRIGNRHPAFDSTVTAYMKKYHPRLITMEGYMPPGISKEFSPRNTPAFWTGILDRSWRNDLRRLILNVDRGIQIYCPVRRHWKWESISAISHR